MLSACRKDGLTEQFVRLGIGHLQTVSAIRTPQGLAGLIRRRGNRGTTRRTHERQHGGQALDEEGKWCWRLNGLWNVLVARSVRHHSLALKFQFQFAGRDLSRRGMIRPHVRHVCSVTGNHALEPGAFEVRSREF